MLHQFAANAAYSWPTDGAAFNQRAGNLNVGMLVCFGGSTPNGFYLEFDADSYNGTGDLTLRVHFSVDGTATTGGVRIAAQVAAMTPTADNIDITTKTFAAAVGVTVTHPGGQAKRPLVAVLTIPAANLDGMNAGDNVVVSVFRDAAHAEDTLIDNVGISLIQASYPDA